MTKADQLSRRERQIMDAIYQLGEASAKDVMANITEPPGYSSVRTLLGKLVEKGHLNHKESGLKYVYYPTVERTAASKSAMSNIVKTFFSDSPYLAFNSLLDTATFDLSDEELAKLEEQIKLKKKQSNK